MNPSMLFYLSSSDSEEESVLPIRKEIRDKSDPFSLPAAATRYRLTKKAFNYVLCHIIFIGHMSTAVPLKLQLAATLSLLASGSFQFSVGNDYSVGLEQSTVCKSCKACNKRSGSKTLPKVYKFLPEQPHACIDHFLRNIKFLELLDV